MAELVVVGVDGSAAGGDALKWAAQYVRERDGVVFAVHVLTYSVEFVRDLPPTGLTAWRQELRDRLEQDWIQEIEHAGVAVRTALLEAESVDLGLMQFAAEHEACMIVLGIHGHSDLGRRLLGGTTYKVAHKSDRPVVIVPVGWSSRSG